MSQKVYTVTIEYDDNRGCKNDIITTDEGHPYYNMTYTQAALAKFISYIEQLEMLQDPVDFHAKVVSVEEQE